MNNQDNLKQGLVNYIGAILESSSFDNQDSRHKIIAMLLEESFKLGTEENNSYNLYVLKPILRAAVVIINNRYKELQELSVTPDKILKEYYDTIQFIDKLLEAIKKEE